MKKDYISLILMAFIALVIMWICYMTAWFGDDMRYCFSCVPGNESHWIESFSDIIASQNAHWLVVENGRYFAHIIVQTFCALDSHILFAICNGLMYISLWIVIAKLSDIRLRNVRGMVSIMILTLLSFQTKMTPSCQVGYIWMFTFTIFWLYIFFKNTKANVFSCILAGVASIIIGNGQEVINLGVCGALIIFWLVNMRKMSTLQYVMMICFGLGTLSNVLSFASITRASGSNNNGLFIWSIITFLRVSRAFYILAAVVLYQCIKKKKSLIVIYKENMFYWNAWAILIAFNFVLSINNNRQLFGAELFAIIISLRMLPNNCLNTVWTWILSVILVGLYILQISCILKVHNTWENILRQYKDSSTGEVYADLYVPNSWFIPYSTSFYPGIPNPDLTDEDSVFGSKHMQNYLRYHFPGKQKMTIIHPSLKDKKHANLTSQVIYLGGLEYLLIENKQTNGTFRQRSYSALGGDTIFTPIDMASNVLTSGDNWNARYAQTTVLNYHTGSQFTTTKQDFVFIPSKK